MKKYFCDICGEPMPVDYMGAPQRQVGTLENICGAADVCPKCAYIGDSMNPRKILLEEWKRRVLEKKGGTNAQSEEKEFRGRNSVEKRGIYEEFVRYRQRVGLDGFGPLQNATGFSDTKLFGMLEGQKFSLADWRTLGKAIRELEEDWA